MTQRDAELAVWAWFGLAYATVALMTLPVALMGSYVRPETATTPKAL